jgi:hypothetical protein
MPWPKKQATAIYLKKRRELGEAKAREWMHAHGHGGRNHKASHARAARRRMKRHHG